MHKSNRGVNPRNLGLSGLASFALPISAVVTGPIFARTIGEIGRGEVTAVTAPVVLGAGVAAAGIVPTAVFFLAGARADRGDVTRRLWRFALASGTVTAVVVALLAPTLLRQSPELVTAGRACALALPLIVLGRVGRATAVADERFDLVAGSSLGAAAARTALVVALAALGRLDVTAAILVVMGYELFLGLPFLPAGARTLASRDGADGPRADLSKVMLRFGGSAAVGSLASIVVVRLDLVVLAPLVSSAELGFYVFAVALGQLWAASIAAAANVALPVSTRTGDPAGAARLSRQLTALSALAVLGSVVVGPTVVRLVYGEGFDETASLLPWLLGSAALFALENLPGAALLADGRPMARSVGPAVAGIFTIAALVAVAPRHGIDGAAAVSVVAYAGAAAITTWMATRSSHLSFFDYVILRPGDLSAASDGRPELEAMGRR